VSKEAREEGGMEVVMQEGSSSAMGRKLWKRCSRDAFGALYNPFVVALAAGTLSITSFQRYIAQDAFFLSSFAEAYGMALQSAEDEEAKATIASLQHAVHEELCLHSSFAEVPPNLSKESF
jgi:thiaminase